MRQVEGDLQTRLTRLIAGWPAGKREAAGEVLAEHQVVVLGVVGSSPIAHPM